MALGLTAAAVNEFYFPLLTRETPSFLFGGAFVLIAFVRLGSGPGLLAVALSLAPNFAAGAVPYNLVIVIYVAEAWVAYFIYRRTTSLILAVTGFWFSVGWLLDIALYGLAAGLTRDYLALLLVKQLLNGLINATLAESLLRIASVRRLLSSPGDPDEATPLQAYSFQGVILVVMVPALGLGMAYTRSAFWNEMAATHARSGHTAEHVSEGIREYLGAIEHTIEQTARQIETVDVATPEFLAARLSSLRTNHSELLKTAVFDAAGLIIASDPRTDLTGRPLAGLSVAREGYFSELVRTNDTVYAPLLDPSFKVRDDDADHVIILAEPLIDSAGSLVGGVVIALDPDALLPVLRTNRNDAAEQVTIWDEQGRVIASLDPGRPVGTDIHEVILNANGTPLAGRAEELPHGIGRTFTYHPPDDGSISSRFGLNPNYATSQLVALSGWSVLVDLPAAQLLHMIVPTAYAVVAVIFVTMALLYLVVVMLTRTLAEPIVTVNRVAADVVGGELATDPGLARLGQSAVSEFRGLAANIMAMQQVLAAQRDRSQAREKEVDERFHATFDQVAVGIAHTALDGTIIRINQKFCDMLGRSREQMNAANFREYTPAEDFAVAQQRAAAVLREERPMYTLEQRLQGVDGVIWVQLTVSLINSSEDAAAYWVQVAQDITARKSLEQQFLQSQKMEGIGVLAGGIAHDFNNLLTPVLGYAEMAIAKTNGDAQTREALDQIHAAATRAKELTWQLLAFSSKQLLDFKIIDLADTIAGFDGMLRLALRENIELITTHEPELGVVRADVAQVQQILMNLVVNAQDAIRGAGTVTVRAANVDVTPEFAARHGDVPDGPAVVLAVGDTGSGITNTVLPNIFDPFFTTKGHGEGSGLGLATVFGIVRQHGGGIVVDSTPGAGSTFSVYFPRVDGKPYVHPPVAPMAPREGQETILVVEDEHAVRRMVAYALRDHGYEVIEAHDAEQAIGLADAAERIDLLLTDIVLPGMNGRQLTDVLATDRPEMTVVYMSGYTRHVLSADGVLEAGTHLLDKPFSIQALGDKVREVLDATQKGSLSR